MALKTKIAALSTLLMFQSFGVAGASSIDRELAVMAAEQDRTGETVETFDPDSIEVDKNKTKTRKELQDEEKRIEDERKAAKKKIKEERKKSRDELQGKTPISKNPAPPVRAPENNSNTPSSQNVEAVKEIPATAENSSTAENSQVVENSANVEDSDTEDNLSKIKNNSPPNATNLNSVVNYSSFNEIVQTVNFIPLYIPKKSGYTITSMATIDNRIAEIRYARNWEPSVSLQVRTYHRPDNEELKDISGISGVKWRINTSNGITTYIAKIADDKHVAAWAVGNYTFSAYAENFSFAEFYSIVTDELVDLTQHYYLIN